LLSYRTPFPMNASATTVTNAPTTRDHRWKIRPLQDRYTMLPVDLQGQWGPGPFFDFPSRVFHPRIAYGLDIGLIVLMIFFGILFSVLDPPNLYFRLDDPAISHPVLPIIISDWAAFLFLIGCILLLLLSFLFVQDKIDLLHAFFGLVECFVFSFATISFLWWSIGGLRPTFLSVCDPDPSKIIAPRFPGEHVYYTHADICRAPYSKGLASADEDTIAFGLRAFQSGHVSFIMAPMLWITLYWTTRFKPFDGFSHLWKIAIIIILPAIGIYGSFTRYHDYHHSVWAITFSILVSVFWTAVFYRFHFRSWFGVDSHISHHGMYRHFRETSDGLPSTSTG